jgi:transposase
MIAPPPNVRVWLACGHTDMRRGFDGLAALVQQTHNLDPFSGQLFAFRGRCGDLIKVLCWDGQGLCLYSKRMEKGHFVWPAATDGAVSLTRPNYRCYWKASIGACRCVLGDRKWRAEKLRF